jgi:hypothetical protein
MPDAVRFRGAQITTPPQNAGLGRLCQTLLFNIGSTAIEPLHGTDQLGPHSPNRVSCIGAQGGHVATQSRGLAAFFNRWRTLWGT